MHTSSTTSSFSMHRQVVTTCKRSNTSMRWGIRLILTLSTKTRAACRNCLVGNLRYWNRVHGRCPCQRVSLMCVIDILSERVKKGIISCPGWPYITLIVSCVQENINTDFVRVRFPALQLSLSFKWARCLLIFLNNSLRYVQQPLVMSLSLSLSLWCSFFFYSV